MRCRNSKRIIVLVPYPAQGHVTPMLNLATAFVAQGYQPLLVTPDYIHRRIAPLAHKQPETHGVAFASVPDGLGEDEPRDFFSIETTMENNMPRHLERLLVGELGVGAVACVVVDLLASWAIDVARRCGVHVAGFWPAMLATYRLIASVPDMVRSGLISETGIPQHQGTIQFQPNQPSLSTEELPWLIGTPAARRARFKFWTRALSRSRTLNFILVNSFPDESPEPNPSQNLVTSSPLLLPIAKPRLPTPTIASPRSFWDEDASCLQWLDEREPNSVIYISFGSWVSPIGESKIRSLAAALESLSGRYFFMWVLGQSWRSGLPEGFEERVKNMGKIVSWAPQTEVLRHESVGFYLTHCGWNSTLEAVECRKRMICYPIAGDQFVNCGYIVKVWKIGVRICGFGKREVEEGLRRVAEDVEMLMRLRKIRDNVMGDEAGFRAKSNLFKFVDFLGKQTNA